MSANLRDINEWIAFHVGIGVAALLYVALMLQLYGQSSMTEFVVTYLVLSVGGIFGRLGIWVYRRLIK